MGTCSLQLYSEQRRCCSITPDVSLWFYLHISFLALGSILVVSQSSKRHILDQLLELLITSNKVCLTVNLHQEDKRRDNGYY